MRIILFAGKGGVGKTSISSATGISSSRMGLRTLVMSLDAAHSLSDSFDLDKELMDRNKGVPLKVDENLWIQEVDIQQEIERHWKNIYSYVTELFHMTGLDDMVSEELAILPGMEEISSLLYINQYIREKEFDTIILDCAPTGESIRFLSIPTALDWYMRKVFKIEKQITKIARPVAKRIYSVPLPEDRYFDSIQSLHDKLKGIDKILGDPRITTVRLITNPEKIVIKETQRAYMYFSLYGLHVDAIIINRILPEKYFEEYLGEWKRIQESYVREIGEIFSPLPVFHIPLFSKEIVGKEDLSRLADVLYEGKNPMDVFHIEKVYSIEKEDGTYRLEVTLPFAGQKDLDLYKKGDELIIRTPGHNQHIMLPKKVASFEPSKATFVGNKLHIHFGGGDGYGKGKETV
jgi:arsenite-transporting ATPase